MRLAVVAFLFFFQGSGPFPDDPNPEWPGQRAYCNNYHSTSPEHRCNCARAQQCDRDKRKDPDLSGETGMGAKCMTYCRPQHCSCLNPCTS